jgi:hypothetical protein
MARTNSRSGSGIAIVALVGSIFAGALGPVGCGSKEESAEVCQSTEEFFAQTVWAKVISQTCINCHNPQGAAKNTNFILKPSSEAGFLHANLEKVREIASFEKNGQSLILLKPSQSIPHEGGVQAGLGTPQYEALAKLVTMFKEGNNCSNKAGAVLTGVQYLNAQETLRKASLALGGRLPTEAEEKWVEEHGEAGLSNVLDHLMTEPAFYVRVREMYNDLFLTDRYVGGDRATNLLDEDDYPNRRWYDNYKREDGQFANNNNQSGSYDSIRSYSNDGLAREAIQLIAHVIKEDRPFTEILTADYTMVNPFSAKVYGLDNVPFKNQNDPTEYAEARIDGIPHAGVLTSPMMLNRFPTTATNRNRHRSRMVYLFFLGTDILKAAEQPLDPAKAEANFPNPTRDAPECIVCHANIDPIAGAFQKWDDQGRFRPDIKWHTDMFPPGFNKETLNPNDYDRGLAWLGERLAKDPRFALATVYTVYTGLTGQKPLIPGDNKSADFDALFQGYLAQTNTFQGIADKFVASKFNFKTVVKEVINSPYFRAKNIDHALSTTEANILGEVGMGRLLTPEQLDRKVEAVLGVAWKSNGTRNLTSTNLYEIFYGGIDSDSVTARVTSPNGIMAGVQERMANEMACTMTAREFSQKPDVRVLFPKVDIKSKPADDLGNEIPAAVASIKENIVYLHHRVLGETLTVDDPEIQRTYQLFLETFKELNKLDDDELPYACRSTQDPLTGKDLPASTKDKPLTDDQWPRQVSTDANHTVRAWMAVLSYLLSDHKFLYE